MSKKTKRYDEGGDIESAQGANKNIGDDVRARAMAAMEKGSSEEAAVPKKTAAKLTPKSEAKYEAETKTNPVQQAKDVIKGKDVSAPKSFSESGGSDKGTKQKADLSGIVPKMPKISDPLAKYEQAGPKRSEQNLPKKKASSGSTDYSVGNAMRKGGTVSSASKRADGIATKGKTRGKIC